MLCYFMSCVGFFCACFLENENKINTKKDVILAIFIALIWPIIIVERILGGKLK